MKLSAFSADNSWDKTQPVLYAWTYINLRI